jgi:CubicO group peptidase (beta-lactamase class C family)
MTNKLDRRRFLEMTACAALAACGGGGGTQREPGPPPDSQIDKAIAELDGIASGLMQRTGLPEMAVAVVRGDRKAYAKGFGTREIGTNAPVDADTVFQLASVSKSIGATVVAKQVGLGRVQWGTRLRTLLPWFALASAQATDAVTVADMYAHRSGLPEHAGDRLEDMGYDRRGVLERLRHYPLEPFREHYDYTNFGMTAAAEAVSVATGSDWASLCEAALYQPLGMTRTTSRYAQFLAQSNRARAHVRYTGKWEVAAIARDADAQSPAGGASSSVNDLANWMAMLLARGMYQGKRVIEEAPLAACVTAQIRSRAGVDGRPDEYYGYGFNVGTTPAGRTTWSHSGAFALGAGTAFRIVPSTNVGIVALTNGYPLGIAEALTLSFFDIVETGAVQRDWLTLIGPSFADILAPEGSLVGVAPPAHPAPPSRALSAYAGVYGNACYGPATVEIAAGALVLSIGPAPLRLTLSHWDADVFTFTLVNENATPGTISKVTFDGERMKIEYYDRDRLGTFVRAS